MYESIVVGTDGSETSKRAVAEATRLGEAMGSTLHVVSAYEPLRGTKIVGAPEGAAKVWSVKPDAEVESIVQQAWQASACATWRSSPYTVTGDPADALLRSPKSRMRT